jgi:rubrerythrin
MKFEKLLFVQQKLPSILHKLPAKFKGEQIVFTWMCPTCNYVAAKTYNLPSYHVNMNMNMLV